MAKKTASSAPELSVVIPMYNESENLEELFRRTGDVLDSITQHWEIICINDGSSDETLARLKKFNRKDRRIKILSLSRQFGKEAAMTAGLRYAGGKAVIPLDADLQDPPELMTEMVTLWKDGYKVVLATRRSRLEESWLKRTTASLFYKVIRNMARIPIPENSGDFRLMDRQVVDVINLLPERTRFMKGLFAWAGFTTTQIFFDRPERSRGKTSWNYWKLWQFALDGILSFSTMPLKVWTYIGALVSLLAFSYASFLIIRTSLYGVDVPGYASLMVAILFLGGIQLISLGIIGEYVGRIYRETKNRPIFVVQEEYGFTKE